MRRFIIGLTVAGSLTGIAIAVHAQSADGTVVPAKFQDRVAADHASAPRPDYGATLTELAQAVRPPSFKASGAVESGLREPRPQDPKGGFGGADMGPPPFGPHHPPQPMRAACLEEIDVNMALAGYVKSKLNLQAGQRDAWRKIEDAAEPHLDRWRKACALLPEKPGASLSLPELVAAAAERTATRAALLAAVSEPVKALYASLAPDQRETLVFAMPPAPPMPLMAPRPAFPHPRGPQAL